jgi:hypothetical protein
MGGTAQYLHLGIILVSTANLVVVLLLILVFAAAIFWRLPGKPSRPILENVGPDQPEGKK